MKAQRTNIVLIGMPGAGKSTVGVVVAKLLAMDFVDTDVLIQAREKRTLQAIIRAEGLSALKQVEEQTLLDLAATQTVIATGGSAVYSDAAMAALKRRGIAVFLDVPLPELVERLNDLDARGVVMEPGESLADLYRKRLPLYQRHADLRLDCGGKSAGQVALETVAAVRPLLAPSAS